MFRNYRSFKPFLHPISKGQPFDKNILKIKEPRREILTFTSSQVQVIHDACSNIRDVLLIRILYDSKTFTALTILGLVESGQIELTDHVTTYIPWLKVKYKSKEIPITIEQMLHQTTGIPPLHYIFLILKIHFKKE